MTILFSCLAAVVGFLSGWAVGRLTRQLPEPPPTTEKERREQREWARFLSYDGFNGAAGD